MILHDKGPKAERDRRALGVRYQQLTKFFRLKPLRPTELAKLNNTQFYRLCEDLYNAQPNKRKEAFTEWLGMTRRNPLAFRWFLNDSLRIYQAKGWRWWVVVLSSPFRYPGFLARTKASAAKEGIDPKTGERIATGGPAGEPVF